MKHIASMLLASSALSMVAAFEGETCETVMINTPAGPTRINKSDYDPKKHGKELKANDADFTPQQAGAGINVPEGALIPPAPSAPNFSGPGPEAGGPTKPVTDPVTGAVVPSNPSHDSVFIKPEGKKFYLIDANGTNIDHPLIDAKGFKTMEDAQEALKEYQRAIPH